MSVLELFLKCKMGSTPTGLFLHGHIDRDQWSGNLAADLWRRIRRITDKRVIVKAMGE
jgi:hypothetical protein